MAGQAQDNLVRVVGDMIYVEGAAVARLIEGAPATLADPFRRCIDGKPFSRMVYKERDAHRPRRD